jgi:hypothetical protein
MICDCGSACGEDRDLEDDSDPVVRFEPVARREQESPKDDDR